jgi:UDP-glucose 4-epimerase
VQVRRILVTGGTGFLGSAISNALADAGHHVAILDSGWRDGKLDTRRLNGLSRFMVYEGEVRDLNALRVAAEGCDSIFHCAAVNGTRHFYEQPELVLDVAVRSIMNIRDIAHGAVMSGRRAPELVLFSSSEVYQTPRIIPTPEAVEFSIPDPFNPRYSYAIGKQLGEMVALHCSALERVIIIRPHNVYGPDMGNEHVIPELVARMQQTQSGEEFEIRGTATRSFIYVEDFTAGVLKAWRSPGKREVYNVGTEDQQPISAVAGKIAKIMGRQGLRWKQGEAAEGGTRKRCPDVSKLRKLGWEPTVSLDEGLERTIGWYTAR